MHTALRSCPRFVPAVLLAVALPLAGDVSARGGEPLRIDAAYPGGNIVVEQIEGDQVFLRPDLRDTQGWWFYWNFRVRGAGGRTLTFEFRGANPIGVRGPAASSDEGRSRSWLGADQVAGQSFSYAFPEGAAEVRFCFAVPYQEEQLRRFLGDHEHQRGLSVRELCQSRKGRSVKRIHVGPVDGDPACRVLLTARHHACESMASYALEGFLAATLADSEEGRWYRKNVEVLAIPLVDHDGVEDGDQGKNRTPHDHNRDYDGESVHPTVAAIRSLVPAWSQGRLRACFDLHCPWIRGPHNEVIYMVGSSDPANWQQQTVFGKLLEQVQQGPLVYRVSDNLPFGTAWNTAGNYSGKMSCSRWAGSIEGVRLATTFEIPYANAAGKIVDAANARAFGQDLARTVRQYLASSLADD